MRQKGFVPTVMLVMIVAAVGIAVYFLKQGSNSNYYKGIADTIMSIAKDNPELSPEATPTPITNILTYINNPNHFSFQYENAQISKCQYGKPSDEPGLAEYPDVGADGTEKSCIDINEIVYDPTTKGLSATIYILSKPSAQSLTDFVSANMNSNKTGKNQTTVGNMSAITITTINEDETLTKVVFIEQLPISVIKITGNYGPNSEILDQILSTFKFTN